jgi:ABC-type multidrug transport system permease subunit
MVPQKEHDFSQYSWSQALIGLSKLAVIMIFALSAIFMIIIALSDMFATEGDELYQQELRGWCNGRHPELTYDECVELEGL